MNVISNFPRLLGDWPMGTILGVLTLVCVVLVIGLVTWGLFVAIDSWFQTQNRKVGRVISKTFTPARTEFILIYNAATKTSLPHPIFHPDDWQVTVEIDGRQDSVSVPKELYDTLTKNDSVFAEYVTGRFSGDIYIRALSYV